MINILFIIGPQRTGTSWIYEQFNSQKEGVYLDLLGIENEFFFKQYSPTEGRKKFLKKLSGNGAPALYADVCSLYFGHIESIKNILVCFPEAKFVFIKREELDRKKSFDEHQNFNKLASKLIGYNISDELYAIQSQFEDFSKEIIGVAGKENCLQLNFKDLKETNGTVWIEELSRFSNIELKYFDKGIVNASRKNSSLTTKVFFFFIRILQKLKVQVMIKKLQLLFK